MIFIGLKWATAAESERSQATTQRPIGSITTIRNSKSKPTEGLKSENLQDSIKILESNSQHNPDGSYNFFFRSADGTFREEKAKLAKNSNDDVYLEVTGSYSYIDTEGNQVIVKYKADENGFVPEGNNIHEDIVVSAKKASDFADKQNNNSGHKGKPDITDDNEYSGDGGFSGDGEASGDDMIR